ncbi:hypothetical protein GOP47_0025977 [Adiantum capillus-veneris]|uniref:Uncharacterized protein n=1 Tax=Adiantum capillus-veneris TaxID=13818 RepID=A0A9D4U271_ADICA|nr:hypothetical protein GOP47_0025977 [Adiantum capillus-veneris]
MPHTFSVSSPHIPWWLLTLTAPRRWPLALLKQRQLVPGLVNSPTTVTSPGGPQSLAWPFSLSPPVVLTVHDFCNSPLLPCQAAPFHAAPSPPPLQRCPCSHTTTQALPWRPCLPALLGQ